MFRDELKPRSIVLLIFFFFFSSRGTDRSANFRLFKVLSCSGNSPRAKPGRFHWLNNLEKAGGPRIGTRTPIKVVLACSWRTAGREWEKERKKGKGGRIEERHSC